MQLLINERKDTELIRNCIIEAGMNDNGYYRKYADGTLEMWGTASVEPTGVCIVHLPMSCTDKTYRAYATPLYFTKNTYPCPGVSVQTSTASQFYIYMREQNGTYCAAGTQCNWFVTGTWK